MSHALNLRRQLAEETERAGLGMEKGEWYFIR